MQTIRRNIKNLSEQTNEINPIVYVVLVLILGILQYTFFINLQGRTVDWIYFLIMMSFLLVSSVNIYVIVLFFQQMKLLGQKILAGDNLLFGIYVFSAVNAVLFLGFLCWKIPLLPANIPIHYSVRNAVDTLGNPQNLVFYFYLVLGIVLANFVLSNSLFRINKLAAYMVASSSLIAEIFIFLVIYANFLMSHLF